MARSIEISSEDVIGMSDRALIDLLTRGRINHSPSIVRAAEAEVERRGGLRALRRRALGAQEDGSAASPAAQADPAIAVNHGEAISARATGGSEPVQSGGLPGVPWAHFTCPRCGSAEKQLDRISTTGGGLSRILHIPTRTFFVVTCQGCGYSELYNERVLRRR